MADRRLVVTDSDPASPEYGRLFALAPNTASAVGIPAFRFGPTKPAVGSELGEAFYETTTRRGWVWDGSGWREIAASPVVTFATEAAMLLDVSKPVGTFAVTADTGQLFVRTNAGWKLQGVKEYPTFAALAADSPVQGALGLVLSEGTLWERTSTNWRLLGLRELPDTAAVVAWTDPKTSNTGDRVLELAHDVLYIRTSTGWRPASLWEDTDANIRAATWALDGQEAVATDSGRTYVHVNGAWQESPIDHYATQAALLAATPAVSQLAWADDTNHVFTWSSTTTQWTGLNTGFDDPVPIGAICDFPSRTIPNGWLECDGSAIPAGTKFDALRTLLGTANLPDLRGLFSRAAKAGEGLLTKVDWTTGRPKTNLTGNTNNTGSHDHGLGAIDLVKTSGGDHNLEPGSGGAAEGRASFRAGGAHAHTVTINGGGDAETAPDHARVVRCIKAFHITTAKPAPDQLLTALTAPTDGQTLLYDASTSSWKNGPVHVDNGGDLWVVGSIQQSILTEPQWAAALGTVEAKKWVLADGRSVAGSKYAAVTGNSSIPDLRGAYMRMAGANGTKANWDGGTLDTYQEDSTALAKNHFVAASDGAHKHEHGTKTTAHPYSFGYKPLGTSGGVLANTGTGGFAQDHAYTSTDGAHTHAISGGDPETRPKSYAVNYFVKIN